MSPSKPAPNGSFTRARVPFPPSSVRFGPLAPKNSRSRCFFGSFRNGSSRSMSKVRLRPSSASRTSRRSPLAQGAIAPSFSDSDSSGTIRIGSKSCTAPRPWQPPHAPCGELNENARGVISGMLTPQNVQASRRENRRSPPSSVLTMTISSARFSAISTDSARRRSIPPFRMSRSTTTSIVWFLRRSRVISSSRERTCPSTRTFVNPRPLSAASSFLNSPLRPRTTGASTLTRSSFGESITTSMIRSSDCEAISRPHRWQCGTPMLAKSSRR